MYIKNINLSYCTKIEIVGLITSEAYQRAKYILKSLSKYYPKIFSDAQVTGLLEVKWQEYLYNVQKERGGSTWSLQRPVMVLVNGRFLGSDEELLALIKTKYAFVEPSLSSLHDLAYRDYTEFLNSNPRRTYVFFEINIGSKYIGGLLFELYSDLLPATCDRFTNLCTQNNKSGISYYGTSIHRVCKSGWFQGGEIYNTVGERFPDENYSISHDQRGILSMANDGKHSNTTQFFITFQPSQWMDCYYVAFGQVVEGTDVLREIENCPCTYESPNQNIVITNCGVLPVGKELRKEKEKLFIKKQKEMPTKLEPYPINSKEFIIRFLMEELDKKLPDDPTDFFISMLFKAIWDKLPVPDLLDLRDVSSKYYLEERYKDGLYSLQYQITTDLLKKYKMSTPKGSYHKEMIDFIIHFVQKRKLHDTDSEISEISSNEFVDKYLLEDVYKTAVAIVDEVQKTAIEITSDNAYKIVTKIISEIIQAVQKAKYDEISDDISHDVINEETKVDELEYARPNSIFEEPIAHEGEDITYDINEEANVNKTGDIAQNIIEETKVDETAENAVHDISIEEPNVVETEDIAHNINEETEDETPEEIANDIINGLIEIALQGILSN